MSGSKTLLIGAGPMAIAYAKALKSQNRDLIVIGRGEGSAKAFTEAVGYNVIQGGLETYLGVADVSDISHAIIALPVPQLAKAVQQLTHAGVPKILVEKPAGLDPTEVRALCDQCASHAANIFVAYNRRFYASVQKAIDMIEADGGVSSFRFEISEYSHIISSSAIADIVKQNWFYANTSHVLDMAFFLGGFPTTLEAKVEGAQSWHGSAAKYAGHGISDKGALFSYHGDWTSAPRWAVEIYTPKHALSLQPLEKLFSRPIDGFAITEIELDHDLDTSFKPGIFKQLEAFLDGTDPEKLITLKTHANHMEAIYAVMHKGGACTA